MARPVRQHPRHVDRRDPDRTQPRRLCRMELWLPTRAEVPGRVVDPVLAAELYHVVDQFYPRPDLDARDFGLFARGNVAHPRQHGFPLVSPEGYELPRSPRAAAPDMDAGF